MYGYVSFLNSCERLVFSLLQTNTRKTGVAVLKCLKYQALPLIVFFICQ